MMSINEGNSERHDHTLKILIKLSLLLLLSSNIELSMAEYRPPTSMEKTVETIMVNADGSNTQIYESTILVETKKGVDDSQQDISYIKSTESVDLLEAYTLQADGKKLKVTAEAIRTTDDSTSNGAPMFSDTKHKIIIFPDVKVGSRLYFKVRSVERIPQFKNQFFQSRFFSPHYRYGDYQINLIVSDKLPIQIDTKGMQGGYTGEINHQKHYHYDFKQNNVKPPEAEEVDLEDFAPYFTVSSFKDQIDLGRAYQKLAHPKTRISRTVKEIADALTQGITDRREQTKILYQWVSKNIRYVAVYLGNGGINPHEAQAILKNRYGDCKDHAVLLEALLRAKGIESSPALINAGEAFTLPKLAVMAPQNHVINYIPSLDLYLDSTAQFAPFGSLPAEDLDKPVILTALDAIGHTPLMRAEDNLKSSKTHIIVNADGTMTGTGESHMIGSTGINFRASQYEDIGTEEEELVKNRLILASETGSGKISATDPSDLDQPFEEKTSFRLDPESNFPGPGAMTIPLGISNPMLALMGKMKPREMRNFPFVCDSNTIEESYLIEFPVNLKVSRIPKDVKFEAVGFKYLASYHLLGNKLNVTRRYQRQNPSRTCLANDTYRQMNFFKVLQRDMRSQVFYD